jgi:hypothetical protein
MLNLKYSLNTATPKLLEKNNISRNNKQLLIFRIGTVYYGTKSACNVHHNYQRKNRVDS